MRRGGRFPRWTAQQIVTETLISEVSALLRQTHESTQQLLFESEQLV
jgi:hypothetical protein